MDLLANQWAICGDLTNISSRNLRRHSSLLSTANRTSKSKICSRVTRTLESKISPSACAKFLVCLIHDRRYLFGFQILVPFNVSQVCFCRFLNLKQKVSKLCNAQCWMTNFFEATQLFNITYFVQCFLYKIPAVLLVLVYNRSGTCAATFVASTYNRDVFKRG